MRMLIGALVIATTFPISGCTSVSPFNPSRDAAGQPAPSQTQAMAAQAGLAAFQGLVNAKNHAALGFTSPEDVRRAHLGEPMPVFLIRLDALQRFQEDTGSDTLLMDAKRALYPVEVDQRVATSLVVTQHDDGWRATDFGNSAVARAVTKHRSSPSDFIVHVPALKVYFVGRKTEGRLTLTPVTDDPRFDFPAGEPLPAERVLMALKQASQGYNGLPQ